MADLASPLEVTISAVTKLRSALTRAKSRQIRSQDERLLMKATAGAWFQSQRPHLLTLASDTHFQEADAAFRALLEYSEQHSSRAKCLALLKNLRESVVKLRSVAMVQSPTLATSRPNFRRLISDARMLQVLERRWDETTRCVEAGANLAATVMLGALLEALLLARINHLQDKRPVFTAQTAPKDSAGKTRPLKEWGLRNFLDVADELGWIRQSAKDVGDVLRDYRNYIHPEKELANNVALDAKDVAMFVSIFCSVAEQVIGSV